MSRVLGTIEDVEEYDLDKSFARSEIIDEIRCLLNAAKNAE